LRILFLHEVNYLEKPIFEMHEFPEQLALRGHEIGFVHFPEGWTSKEIRKQGFRSKIQGRVAQEASLTLYTPRVGAGDLLGRISAILGFRWFFRKVLRDFQPEIVVSYSVPTSGWQALIEARKESIPYLFRALDVSHKIRKTAFQRFIKLAEKFIYRNTLYLSANNPAMASYCITMGAREESVSIEHPPLDIELFSVAKRYRSEYRNKLGINEGAKVVLYMGSFFYFSGLPEVVENLLKRKSINIKLLLVGGGEQEQEVKELVRTLGLDSAVIFTGFVNFHDLPKYLGTADVAINPMQRTLVSNAAFPNKVIQYMACGLPVVSTDLAGLRLTFNELPGLKFAESPSHVLSEVENLLQSSELSDSGVQNRIAVERIFSKDQSTTSFEELLISIVGKHA
jgi:glycosyltransferase involved in cell wall biosynthesis